MALIRGSTAFWWSEQKEDGRSPCVLDEALVVLAQFVRRKALLGEARVSLTNVDRLGRANDAACAFDWQTSRQSTSEPLAISGLAPAPRTRSPRSVEGAA